jgi:hypothetical protein
MKIGAWGFNEIVAMAFEKGRIKFTTTWLFVILAVSVLANILVNTLLNSGIQGFGITIVDTLNLATAVLLILYISLGITASLKTTTKTKAKSFAALVKPLYLKQLLVMLLGIAVVVAGVILTIAAGQLSRIPFAGPVLMALLTVPFVIALAYLVVFATLSMKLSAAAVVENSKASVKDIVRELLVMTKNNFAKVVFNSFLMLLPIITVVLAATLILGVAYVFYIMFGWVMTSCYSVLALSMQGQLNLIFVLQTLSGLALLSYALSYVLNLSLTGFYSIYLDARK